MGSTCACSCDNDSSCVPNDVSAGQFQKRRSGRNAPQITRNLPSNSIVNMDTNESSKPMVPIFPVSNLNTGNELEPALDDISSVHIDLGLFGVDQDTMELLLKLDDMNSINDNLLIHSVDIDSKSKQQCIPQITVSQMNSTTLQPKPFDDIIKYEISDSCSDESSDDSDRNLFHNDSLGITRDLLHPKQRKSHLITSNDEWESEDIDDLEAEMKREYNHLSERSGTSTTSTSTSTCATTSLLTPHGDMNSDLDNLPASLFRLKSADKWNVDDIDSQRDEITKQIIHLASNNVPFINE